jgi:hypothetical protein
VYSEETIKQMTDLFGDPIFKTSFFEFFTKMQKEGIEAAKRFWSMHPEKNVFAASPDIFEKMVDFYIILGFVPHYKYDEAVKENEKLRKEVEFLRTTMKELQNTLFTEGTQKTQELWKSIVDNQLEMHKEIAKNFFELFKSMKS